MRYPNPIKNITIIPTTYGNNGLSAMDEDISDFDDVNLLMPILNPIIPMIDSVNTEILVNFSCFIFITSLFIIHIDRQTEKRVVGFI